jgi:hypothetical protein
LTLVSTQFAPQRVWLALVQPVDASGVLVPESGRTPVSVVPPSRRTTTSSIAHALNTTATNATPHLDQFIASSLLPSILCKSAERTQAQEVVNKGDGHAMSSGHVCRRIPTQTLRVPAATRRFVPPRRARREARSSCR